MEINLQPRYIRGTAVALVIFFVVLSSCYGWRAGLDLAKSEFTLRQVRMVLDGLAQFHQDQDRYPSLREFEDSSAFGKYLNPVPVAQIASKACTVSVAYQTFNQRSFSLTYCLPRTKTILATGQAGLHEVTDRTMALWPQSDVPEPPPPAAQTSGKKKK